ncbi:hypothetical protein CAPTEDRAFT_188236 [Capitella teleta]|uniref:Uncharacterized protein n=1 Tax=Capitella teleta TaxID=283909 RepID=R7T8U3_CAPTE|nr:hypothetical protein CAPTEDRAFT_188236 [Capitella teleta]|eukprot:ELT87419.1 hypothetical protein CAPTEDRAFT_188236 [Capitella teleta]
MQRSGRSGQRGLCQPASQPAIHKAIYKRAAEVKQHLVNTLHQGKWSLHFDGKHLDGLEHQAVVLKNEEREIKLAVLRLKDGKAATIAQTQSVNTGKEKGSSVASTMCLTASSVSSWIVSLWGRPIKSPNSEYFSVKDLMENYEQLKAGFSNGKAVIQESSGWRDDMKFLFHLTRVFSHFMENQEFLFVKFQQIPNISNARWNSRAILALLAFILMPETRSRLESVCTFISHPWANQWFSNQLFREADFDELSEALATYPKALESLKNHWKRENQQSTFLAVTNAANVLKRTDTVHTCGLKLATFCSHNLWDDLITNNSLERD